MPFNNEVLKIRTGSKTGRLKAISLLLVAAVLCQELGYAYPDPKIVPWEAVEGARSQAWATQLLAALPSAVAVLEEAHRDPASTKTLFLIQDAHTNTSGQFNAARTLEFLCHKMPDIQYVFLEAGSGDESLSFLKPHAGLDKRKRVAGSFVRQGRLQGSEYASLTMDRDVVLWGVEDMSLYAQSVEIYRQVYGQRDRFLDYLDRIDTEIRAIKPRIFNPFLRAFDDKYQQFERGRVALTDDLDELVREARKQMISLEAYEHLLRLSQLKELESKIDFQRANEEQQKAVALLPEMKRRTLAENSPNSHAIARISSEGGASDQAFFVLMEDMLKDSPGPYPELLKYLAYRREAAKIDARAVLEEQRSLRRLIFRSLTMNPDEESLIKASANIRSLKKLLLLTLTPDEFQDYLRDRRGFDIVRMTGFLNKKIMDLNDHHDKVVFLEPGYKALVRQCERFYELTRERDNKFVENLILKMNAERQSTAVLITGGYHGPSLKYLLKAQGISYISVTPQVFQETDMKRYEQILLKTRFDRPGGLSGGAMKPTAGTTMPVRITAGARLSDLFALADQIAGSQGTAAARMTLSRRDIAARASDSRSSTAARLAVSTPSLKTVGFVGLGPQGQRLIETALGGDPELRLIAVARGEQKFKSAQQVFDGHPNKSRLQLTRGDAEIIFADPSIQAVVIATGAGDHYSQVKQALENGKHVFVEKPFVLEKVQAEELVALAEAKGLILMVGHQFLYTGLFQKLKEVMQTGALGEITSIEASFLNPLRQDIDNTSDVIEDLATHDLYMILDLCGGQEIRLESAQNTSRPDSSKPTKLEAAEIKLSFGKTPVTIRVSREYIGPTPEAPQRVRELVVRGTQATATFTHSDPNGLVIDPVDRAQAPTTFTDKTLALGPELEAFFDAITTGETPRSSGASAVGVVSLVEQIKGMILGAYRASRQRTKDEIRKNRIELGLHFREGQAFERKGDGITNLAKSIIKAKFVLGIESDDVGSLGRLRQHPDTRSATLLYIATKTPQLAKQAAEAGADAILLSGDDEGLSVLREIRKSYPEVLILVESALSREDARAVQHMQTVITDLEQKGADGVLFKPYRIKEDNQWKEHISPDVLRELARAHPDILLGIAGGITEDNVAAVLALPVNVFVFASLFGATDEKGIAQKVDRYRAAAGTQQQAPSGARLVERGDTPEAITTWHAVFHDSLADIKAYPDPGAWEQMKSFFDPNKSLGMNYEGTYSVILRVGNETIIEQGREHFIDFLKYIYQDLPDDVGSSLLSERARWMADESNAHITVATLQMPDNWPGHENDPRLTKGDITKIQTLLSEEALKTAPLELQWVGHAIGANGGHVSLFYDPSGAFENFRSTIIDRAHKGTDGRSWPDHRGNIIHMTNGRIMGWQKLSDDQREAVLSRAREMASRYEKEWRDRIGSSTPSTVTIQKAFLYNGGDRVFDIGVPFRGPGTYTEVTPGARLADDPRDSGETDRVAGPANELRLIKHALYLDPESLTLYELLERPTQSGVYKVRRRDGTQGWGYVLNNALHREKISRLAQTRGETWFSGKLVLFTPAVEVSDKYSILEFPNPEDIRALYKSVCGLGNFERTHPSNTKEMLDAINASLSLPTLREALMRELLKQEPSEASAVGSNSDFTSRDPDKIAPINRRLLHRLFDAPKTPETGYVLLNGEVTPEASKLIDECIKTKYNGTFFLLLMGFDVVSRRIWRSDKNLLTGKRLPSSEIRKIFYRELENSFPVLYKSLGMFTLDEFRSETHTIAEEVGQLYSDISNLYKKYKKMAPSVERNDNDGVLEAINKALGDEQLKSVLMAELKLNDSEMDPDEPLEHTNRRLMEAAVPRARHRKNNARYYFWSYIKNLGFSGFRVGDFNMDLTRELLKNDTPLSHRVRQELGLDVAGVDTVSEQDVVRAFNRLITDPHLHSLISESADNPTQDDEILRLLRSAQIPDRHDPSERRAKPLNTELLKIIYPQTQESQILKENSKAQAFLEKVFWKIYKKTGEDVVLTAVLDSFGREANGLHHRYSFGWLQAATTKRYRSDRGWPDFRDIKPHVDRKLRTVLLRGGLQAFRSALFNPNADRRMIAAQRYKYNMIKDTYNLYLGTYFSKTDPRSDEFSRLMRELKRDPTQAGHIYPYIQDRLRKLVEGPLGEVDLVVPAPSIKPHSNQTIPLAHLVHRELSALYGEGKSAHLSLKALKQVRPRKRAQKKQKKLWRRALNSGGLFEGDPQLLLGKRVVIVDDNETTGYTAAAMCAAAYAAGASSVIVLSFGRSAGGSKAEKLYDEDKLSPAIEYTVHDWLGVILGSDLPSDQKVEAALVLLQSGRMDIGPSVKGLNQLLGDPKLSLDERRKVLGLLLEFAKWAPKETIEAWEDSWKTDIKQMLMAVTSEYVLCRLAAEVLVRLGLVDPEHLRDPLDPDKEIFPPKIVRAVRRALATDGRARERSGVVKKFQELAQPRPGKDKDPKQTLADARTHLTRGNELPARFASLPSILHDPLDPVDRSKTIAFLAGIVRKKGGGGLIAIGRFVFQVRRTNPGYKIYAGKREIATMEGKGIKGAEGPSGNQRTGTTTIIGNVAKGLWGNQRTVITTLGEFKQLWDRIHEPLEDSQSGSLPESPDQKNAVVVFNLEGLSPEVPGFDEVTLPLLLRAIKLTHQRSWGANSRVLLKAQNDDLMKRAKSQIDTLFPEGQDFICTSEGELGEQYINATRITIITPDQAAKLPEPSPDSKVEQRYFLMQSLQAGDIPNFRWALWASLSLARVDLKANDKTLKEVLDAFKHFYGDELNINTWIEITKDPGSRTSKTLEMYALPPITQLPFEEAVRGARLAIRQIAQSA